MESQNQPIFKLLLLFLGIIILSSCLAIAFFVGQTACKKEITKEIGNLQKEISTARSPILLNPVLNVSQNQKYMELLNLDNQIISLLGYPYLQTNPTTSFLKPYAQGLSPQESSTQNLKNLFQQRSSLIKNLGLVEEEQ